MYWLRQLTSLSGHWPLPAKLFVDASVSGLITSLHISGKAKVVNMLVWVVAESGCR